MGLPGVTITFSGAVPSASEIVAEAFRIGGLALVMEPSAHDQTRVHFAAFPEGSVTLVSHRGGKLFIGDYSLKAPTLYPLLWQAAAELGGQPACSYPTPLPVSEALVRRDLRHMYFLNALVLLPLLAVAITLVAAAIGIAWWLVKLSTG